MAMHEIPLVDLDSNTFAARVPATSSQCGEDSILWVICTRGELRIPHNFILACNTEFRCCHEDFLRMRTQSKSFNNFNFEVMWRKYLIRVTKYVNRSNPPHSNSDTSRYTRVAVGELQDIMIH